MNSIEEEISYNSSIGEIKTNTVSGTSCTNTKNSLELDLFETWCKFHLTANDVDPKYSLKILNIILLQIQFLVTNLVSICFLSSVISIFKRNNLFHTTKHASKLH